MTEITNDNIEVNIIDKILISEINNDNLQVDIIDNVLISEINNDNISVNFTASGIQTFESISKNLNSYPYTIDTTGYIFNYDLGSGLSIIKTIEFDGNFTTISLSGDLPIGIPTQKVIEKVGENYNITYN